MQQLGDGTFSKSGNPDEFKDVLNNLLYHDRYLTFADYDAYIEAQDKVNACYMVSKVLSKLVELIIEHSALLGFSTPTKKSMYFYTFIMQLCIK